MLKDGGMIFGSGLVPAFGKWLREDAMRAKSARSRVTKLWSGLERFSVDRGEPAARLLSLEKAGATTASGNENNQCDNTAGAVRF